MYYLDPTTQDIIISGFENGIGDSPYSGMTDMKNVNIISVPGEASVNFSTSQISAAAITGNQAIDSADAGTYYFHQSGGSYGFEEDYMAVVFSAQNNLLPGGNADLGKVFWIINKGVAGLGTFQLTSDYQQTTIIHPTNGTGTFQIINMDMPKYFAADSTSTSTRGYWMVDNSGRVWSNIFDTTSGKWTYTGNLVPSGKTIGNGLVYYQASNGTGYLFVFHNGSIDYTLTADANISWVYQWNPATGSIGSYSATPTQVLKTSTSVSNPHEAMVAPDSRVYYCDSNWIGRWYQENPSVAFDPQTKSTYVFDTTQLLPTTDRANCLSFLGTNLMIGGTRNVIYPWNRYDTNFNFPILIAENYVQKMVTVNTNTFIFAGNRGRIYITNGSQAQLYKKIPDHLSNTVEPYFTWGGACSVKNQLYFGALATTNASAEIEGYGGLWAIDLDTSAIRLVNEPPYNTDFGYVTAVIPIMTGMSANQANPVGTGLFIGWQSNVSIPTYGMDTTVAAPYTGGQSYVVSDMIPIGTLLKPTTVKQIEFKLSKPLLANESVELQIGKYVGDTFVTCGTTSGSNTTVILSGNFPAAVQGLQWIMIKAILTSRSSSPSYTRLTQLRIINK